LDATKRSSEPDFKPEVQDVLNCRVMTTGISEVFVTAGQQTFQIVDVGGQRSERKKWIHQFAGVQSIIFITSLSEYNQTLREDIHTNRSKESLELFGQTINSDIFRQTPIILFLNKVDIFRTKIKQFPLNETFPDYTGPPEEQPCLKFMVKQFTAQNNFPSRAIYPNVTHATDTKAMKAIWVAVSDIITRDALESHGLA